MTDAAGRPVPDGMRIAVTAETWYRVVDGGWHNGSFGGSIIGGDAVPNDWRFRSFVVNGGQVTFTYSNIGLVLGTGGTATTVISILPAVGQRRSDRVDAVRRRADDAGGVDERDGGRDAAVDARGRRAAAGGDRGDEHPRRARQHWCRTARASR